MRVIQVLGIALIAACSSSTSPSGSADSGGGGSDASGDSGDGGGNDGGLCDLASPNSCGGGGQGCLYAKAGLGSTYCGTVGSLGQGAACSQATDCSPGLNCAINGIGSTQYTCKQWCYATGGVCPGSLTCNVLGLGIQVNGQRYGWCQ